MSAKLILIRDDFAGGYTDTDNMARTSLSVLQYSRSTGTEACREFLANQAKQASHI